MATSMLIVKKFVADEVNLIFTISTPSTQHAVKATSKLPIIFGAVTDPVSAGIVKDLQHPGGNVTGVSDVWPIKKQVELLLKLVPSVKKLGLVYNPGESNATFMLGKLREACDQLGIELVTRAISNTGEVMMAAKNLSPRVDAFYSSIDNTVLAAIASLVKAANQYKKPIIAGESDSVKEGAIATLGTNYFEIGKDSGKLAVKVLEGADPGDLPVISDTKTDFYLNLKATKFLDIKVPPEMEENAKEIFD
jgi:putative tryptophan/tyrosine transport system substrate-binding protein